ncbi:hypothetical protein [Kineococcus radiotolerans]|uniref:hypothetical protein n=1 Tax=Kineococcus radiotolerans TaxID=131568 RepID=UPI001607285E|nr:hypothetical protein [Kineococcus radiotolerans]
MTAAPVPGRGRTDRLPLVLLFGQALLGLVVGVVWWALTRHPPTWVVGEPVVTSPAVYPVARDGVFTVLTGLLGVLAGLAVVRAPGPRPLLLLGAALAGAAAGALLAAGLGTSLPPTDPADSAHVTLHAWVVLLVQPFVVAVVVALVTLTRSLLEWTRAP